MNGAQTAKMQSTRPRTGHIQFLNCLPIYYGLVNGNGILDLELVRGNPTELNAFLMKGRLDISPVSSIEYARQRDELLLLPGPTVSCHGPVQSILLISRCPIWELHGEDVGLTSLSATSHVLLRIIMERLYNVSPRFFTFSGDLKDALRCGKAALLIGDAALRNLSPGPRFHVYDLGREWRTLTGEGMVFAVWAVRREFAAARPDLVTHAWRLFRDSISYCRGHLDIIAADAARWEPFDSAFLEEYFRSLSFDFTASLLRGLERFYAEACALGHLDAVPTLEFFSPEHACHVPEKSM